MKKGSLISCVFLMGCAGPLLSPPVQKKISMINVCNIEERPGQVLRQRLINAFKGSGGVPKRYDLKIKLVEDSYGMGMGTDARTTICHLATRAHYTLTQRGCVKPIAEGVISAQNSYDVLTPTGIALANSYYSTTTSEDFVRMTNIHQLVPMLLAEMARLFSNPSFKPADEEGLFFEADQVP